MVDVRGVKELGKNRQCFTKCVWSRFSKMTRYCFFESGCIWTLQKKQYLCVLASLFFAWILLFDGFFLVEGFQLRPFQAGGTIEDGS